MNLHVGYGMFLALKATMFRLFTVTALSALSCVHVEPAPESAEDVLSISDDEGGTTSVNARQARPTDRLETAGCSVPVAGLESLIKPGNVLLFGELQGTVEIPALVGAIACHAAHRDLTVRLGIQHDASHSNAATRWMNSDGGAGAERAFTGSPSWNPTLHDGRATVAMLDLFKQAHSLRHSGLDMDVFLIDEPAPPEGETRGWRMALHVLRAADQEPDAMIVVLAEHTHVRKITGVPWDRQGNFEPMGWHIWRKLPSRTVALNAAYPDGEAWNCRNRNQCRVWPVRGRGKPEVGHAIWLQAPGDRSYDGLFNIPSTTASLPIP